MFLIGAFEIFICFALFVALIFVIIKQINARDSEDFEDRDN